jgi:hypothetical protein
MLYYFSFLLILSALCKIEKEDLQNGYKSFFLLHINFTFVENYSVWIKTHYKIPKLDFCYN